MILKGIKKKYNNWKEFVNYDLRKFWKKRLQIFRTIKLIIVIIPKIKLYK